MRHRVLIFLSALLLYTQSAFANDVISTSVPSASVVGRGVLSYLFWDVYEATLYAPKGRFNPVEPFALSIQYYREIKGRDIADRSVQEMRTQGFTDEVRLAAWNAQMKEIFPDVRNDTVLTAVYIPGKQTVFYNGTKHIGTINGDDFGRLFFGIWLDERTTEPDLRRALLGLS